MFITLGLAGILFVLIGVLLTMDYVSHRKLAVRTYGTVTAIEKYQITNEDIDNIRTQTQRYRPVIEYSVDGRTYHTNNISGYPRIMYSLQQRVPLIITSADPADALPDSPKQLVIGIAHIIFGIVFWGVVWYVHEFNFLDMLLALALLIGIGFQCNRIVKSSNAHSLNEFLPKFRSFFYTGRIPGVTLDYPQLVPQSPSVLLTTREQLREEQARLTRSGKLIGIVFILIGSAMIWVGVKLYQNAFSFLPNSEPISYFFFAFGALLVLLGTLAFAGIGQ